jgi:ferredoxin--NADP+ reductase
MTIAPSPTVAIVGSGPSGGYAAQSLRRLLPEADITVFEKLPTPFGLIRYGVAPDHQGTKAVIRQFDRLFERESVRFAGGIEVGVDISLDDLEDAFDIVILATGLEHDNVLGIEGEFLEGVYGSGEFMRTVNGYPDQPVTDRLGGRVVVIGAGNVALDVTRLLAKTPADFAGSDLDDEAWAALLDRPVTRIDVVARSTPERAKWDSTMVRELGRLPGVVFELPELPATEQQLDERESSAFSALQSLPTDGEARLVIGLHFQLSATSASGNERGHVERIEFVAADGSTRSFDADTVVKAIGLKDHASTGKTLRAEHAGLYHVGWLRSGSRGTIPDHRVEARSLAQTVEATLAANRLPLGHPGWYGLPDSVREKAISFAQWKLIDAEEIAGAGPERVRRKVRDLARLREIAQVGELIAGGER